jgi:hypothetical protein
MGRRSARWKCRSVAFVWLLAYGAIDPARTAAEPVEAPKVGSIKAFLFDEETGLVDPQEFFSNPENGSAWNDTTTGAMLVIVELTGPRDQRYGRDSAPSYSVRLDAIDVRTSKQLFTAVRPVRRLTERGNLYIAFLLYPNTCRPLRLMAKLNGPRAGKPVAVNANFACGE